MCSPEDINGFAQGIKKLKENPVMRENMGKHNKETVKPYCIEETKKEVVKLFKGLYKERGNGHGESTSYFS